VRPSNPPGTPIDAARYRDWTNRFGAYRDGVTNLTIDAWLDQFKRDRDLGARILDAVEFYAQAQILQSFRQALNSIPGWNRDSALRQGNWRFAAMSSSAGESGDSMLHLFRLANQLDGRAYNSLFVNRSDLFRQVDLPEDDPNKLGSNDTVVLLDDFSGTGDQVVNAWNNPDTSFGAFLSSVGRRYLVLIAASRNARQRITDETDLSPIPAHELTECDDVFSPNCLNFTEGDREKLLIYGRTANRKLPQGYGKCGLLVIFQHRAPNDSLPILHSLHDRWAGLFPRHEPTIAG
jgi:hypothetical protein